MLDAVKKLLRPVVPRPPDAPTPDLETQRAEAQVALDEAQEEVEHARATYDARGDDESLQALLAAVQAADAAAEQLGRAGRLLEAARRREERNEHAALERERDELIASLERDALLELALPHAQAETEALLAFGTARLERQRLKREAEARLHRLKSVLRELGYEHPRGPQVFTDEDGFERSRMPPQSPEDVARRALPVLTDVQVTREALGAALGAADERRPFIYQLLEDR